MMMRRSTAVQSTGVISRATAATRRRGENMARAGGGIRTSTKETLERTKDRLIRLAGIRRESRGTSATARYVGLVSVRWLYLLDAVGRGVLVAEGVTSGDAVVRRLGGVMVRVVVVRSRAARRRRLVIAGEDQTAVDG